MLEVAELSQLFIDCPILENVICGKRQNNPSAIQPDSAKIKTKSKDGSSNSSSNSNSNSTKCTEFNNTKSKEKRDCNKEFVNAISLEAGLICQKKVICYGIKCDHSVTLSGLTLHYSSVMHEYCSQDWIKTQWIRLTNHELRSIIDFFSLCCQSSVFCLFLVF